MLQEADGIQTIKGVKGDGKTRESGIVLTKAQAQKLLKAPDAETVKGQRDRAILALLIGCGLRRPEVVSLTFDQIRQRAKRCVLVDVIGKRTKARTVPFPAWAKAAISAYARTASLSEGRVFRSIDKAGRVGESVSEQAIHYMILAYSEALGFGKEAPNLRLTFATLARQGGSSVDQISLALGHGSIEITERFLDIEQDLTYAPCDHVGLKI